MWALIGIDWHSIRTGFARECSPLWADHAQGRLWLVVIGGDELAVNAKHQRHIDMPELLRHVPGVGPNGQQTN